MVDVHAGYVPAIPPDLLTHQAGLGVAFTDSPTWREILTLEAREGRWRGYWLLCGGQPVAYEVGCVYDDTFFLEATGFLPELGRFNPGTLLLIKVFENLRADGIAKVDYGFGDAEYKRVYGSESWCESTIVVFSPRSARACSSWLLSKSANGGRLALEALGRLTRIDAKLKKTWRIRRQKTADHNYTAGDRA